MGYGVEIWDWEEREGMERLQDRYLRWLLGVEWGTPGYMIREEIQRDKMRGRMGRRAWSYKKKLEEGKGGILARKCLEEIRRRIMKEEASSTWEEERKGFFSKRGMDVKKVEKGRKKGEFRWEVVEKEEKRRQREERWKRIRESKYNA